MVIGLHELAANLGTADATAAVPGSDAIIVVSASVPMHSATTSGTNLLSA